MHRNLPKSHKKVSPWTLAFGLQLLKRRVFLIVTLDAKMSNFFSALGSDDDEPKTRVQAGKDSGKSKGEGEL